MSSKAWGRGLLALGLDADEEEEEDEPLPLSFTPTADSLLANTNSNTNNAIKNPLFTLQLDAMEDDEEDMPLEPLTEAMELPISQDFIDSQRSIDENIYDTSAWRVYLEEALRSKGGAVSPPDAYNKFLEIFPRSAAHWRGFIAYYLQKNDVQEADKVAVRSNVSKVRNVGLWLDYITVKKKLLSMDGDKMKDIYEEAVRNVGLSIDAGTLWRDYIDFVTDLNDSRSLRLIYKRALRIPLDNLDALYLRYEKFEKSAGEHLADKILPEIREKMIQAKNLYKERRRLLRNCDFERLACPPSNSSSEITQLEAWNRVFW